MSKPDRVASQPLVTIVTPSFNQGEFLAHAIDSVLAQDYPAIEYIVVDGGSTDRTIDVLRAYGDRIRWTSGPDGGQSDAIHRGFLAGSGEYLAWLNSDDRYVPGAIGAAVQEMAADPSVALLYGRGEFIDRDGEVTGPCLHVEPWSFERLVGALNLILQPATLFRRDAYLEIGGLTSHSTTAWTMTCGSGLDPDTQSGSCHEFLPRRASMARRRRPAGAFPASRRSSGWSAGTAAEACQAPTVGRCGWRSSKPSPFR